MNQPSKKRNSSITTLKIAGTELSLLFYSPIAWFLLVAFLFQCALTYIDAVDGNLIYQQLGGTYLDQLYYLTRKIFCDRPSGYFLEVKNYIYLYLPLLTMGLISREISSGTIKLLYSSPARLREIVYGKFTAMMAFCAVLTAVMGIFAVTGMFNIQHADIGLILSGLLGMFLLMCTYAAIGLFMSCLTSYQIVAAICTLVLLGVLNYIGTLWQDVDFVRDLTNYLSISGRSEKIIYGLITTRDVLYFIVIIAMFIHFTITRLQFMRRSVPVWHKVARYTLPVISALVIGYISNRPGWVGYYDATATQTMTITENARNIIGSMKDGPLQVTSYINLLDFTFWWGAPKQRNEDLARWDRYIRFKPDIQLKYVYYYDSSLDYRDKHIYRDSLPLSKIAERYLTSTRLNARMFKTPEEMRRIIDLRPEKNRYVMKLEYKGRSTMLRVFDDPAFFPAESETSAALKRLLQAVPRIGFAQGHLERSVTRKGEKDYQMLTREIPFRNALINQGFDIENVDLTQQEIPKGLAALVIADPRTAFDSVAERRIQQYINSGGNLLIAGEPGKQAILNPLLEQMGVQMMDGTLIQQSNDFKPDLVLPRITDTAASLSGSLRAASENSTPVSMSGVAALSYTSNGAYDIKPLLMTDPADTWVKAGKLVTDSAKVVYLPEEGDVKGSFATALGLTRKVNGREQRIIITGDADFLSDAELRRFRPYVANFRFSVALFGWFTYEEFPVRSPRPEAPDQRLTLTKEGFSVLKLVSLGVFPALMLALGTVLLIRRKRK